MRKRPIRELSRFDLHISRCASLSLLFACSRRASISISTRNVIRTLFAFCKRTSCIADALKRFPLQAKKLVLLLGRKDVQLKRFFSAQLQKSANYKLKSPRARNVFPALYREIKFGSVATGGRDIGNFREVVAENASDVVRDGRRDRKNISAIKGARDVAPTDRLTGSRGGDPVSPWKINVSSWQKRR